MIRSDQIPDEVVEAAAIVLMGRLMVSHQDALHVWSGMYEPEKDQFRREARASITAALNAWPWKFTAESIKMPHIVLPLPDKEVSDE